MSEEGYVSISKTILGSLIGALVPTIVGIWYLSSVLATHTDQISANSHRIDDHETRIRAIEHSPNFDTSYYRRYR